MRHTEEEKRRVSHAAHSSRSSRTRPQSCRTFRLHPLRPRASRSVFFFRSAPERHQYDGKQPETGRESAGCCDACRYEEPMERFELSTPALRKWSDGLDHRRAIPRHDETIEPAEEGRQEAESPADPLGGAECGGGGAADAAGSGAGDSLQDGGLHRAAEGGTHRAAAATWTSTGGRTRRSSCPASSRRTTTDARLLLVPAWLRGWVADCGKGQGDLVFAVPEKITPIMKRTCAGGGRVPGRPGPQRRLPRPAEIRRHDAGCRRGAGAHRQLLMRHGDVRLTMQTYDDSTSRRWRRRCGHVRGWV